MNTVPRPPMWNTSQVAAYLNTTPGRLANMRCAGIGPAFVKVGHSVRYRIEDIDAYLNACTVQPLSA